MIKSTPEYANSFEKQFIDIVDQKLSIGLSNILLDIQELQI